MVVYAERAVMGIHHGQFTPGPVNNCYAQKKKKNSAPETGSEPTTIDPYCLVDKR